MAHGFDATCQNKIGSPGCNILCGAVDCLQPGSAIALHSPRRYPFIASQPESNYTGNISLIRTRHYAANDYLVKFVNAEWLAVKQCATRLERQV